jgi:cyclase
MTLGVRVIPCLDVKDGRVVKGVNFVGLRDAGDPVEQARTYDAAGADELMFLDITASTEGRGAFLDVVRRTADACFMPVVRRRAGVRQVEDVRALLLGRGGQGVHEHRRRGGPDLISRAADAFGAQCIVVAIDARARENGGGYEVVTYGGRRRPAGRGGVGRGGAAARRGRDIADVHEPRWREDGIRHPAAAGGDAAVTIPVIASGGAGNAAHMVEAVRDGGANAVLAASIFHWGEVSVGRG